MRAHGGSELMRSLMTKWRDYRATLAGLRELESNDPGLLAELAGELGLSASDLREVVAHGAGADRLMHRMMAAYDLDAEKLQDGAPGVLREIEILCSRCGAKGRCARELDAGTAAGNAHAFCPNVETFEALAQAPAG
jgi:Family of unknown function (DUF6455)